MLVKLPTASIMGKMCNDNRQVSHKRILRGVRAAKVCCAHVVPILLMFAARDSILAQGASADWVSVIEKDVMISLSLSSSPLWFAFLRVSTVQKGRAQMLV